ncbi:MAG: hypothetical protein A4S09_00075 [Proteobacteria bacterium SG_bin7]|nr:MAG: hypothetical protein A4S09_00075 [Proteobacteria bacterium SG_bin7]
MDVGPSDYKGRTSDSLSDDSFQDLLQEKVQLAPELTNKQTNGKKIDAGEPTKSVDIKEDDSFEKLEEPILFAPELPKVLEAFPVASENIGPMRQFLAKIDKEAGVKPEVWAEAMLKLKPEEQLKSPWETAKAVVAQLEIPGDKKTTVVKAYDKLLADINIAGDIAEKNDEQLTTEALIALAPMMAAASAIKEASVKEFAVKPEMVKKAKLNDDVGLIKAKGTERKLMPFGEAVEERPVTAMVESPEKGLDLSSFSKMEKIDPKAAPKFNLNKIETSITESEPMEFKNVSAPAPEKLSRVTQVQMAEQIPVEAMSMEATTPLAAEEAVISKFSFEDKNLNENESFSSNSSGDIKDVKVQNYRKLDLSDFKADTKSGGKRQALNSEHKIESESKATKPVEMPKFFIDNNSQVSSRELTVRTEGVGAGMMAGAAAINREDVNTAEIIRQAQFMVRNGGGEVKIKLNPENLGEVSMKMSVDGDKVQLALDTSTHEAKKLIESSINELRATLSANKLSLENVKVDVAGKSDNQFSHHRNEADGGAAREQARQFLNNFREDNQSRRSTIAHDMGEIRPRPTNRTAVPTSGRNSYSRGASASGRLNLVA